jgi:hypothetical protein
MSSVGLDADEDADSLGLRERGVELVEAADEKVADEAVEKPGVVAGQDTEAVAQVFPLLVGDEGQVGRHEQSDWKPFPHGCESSGATG